MCHKRRYRDEISAKVALATITRKDKRPTHGHQARECDAYPCPECHGWHLTSIPRNTTRKINA